MSIEELNDYEKELTARRERELEKLKKENALYRALIAYREFHEGLPSLGLRRCWQPKHVAIPWSQA